MASNLISEYRGQEHAVLMGELVAVVLIAESHPPSLDGVLLFMDRSDPEIFRTPWPRSPNSCNAKAGSTSSASMRREVIFTIEAVSLA